MGARHRTLSPAQRSAAQRSAAQRSAGCLIVPCFERRFQKKKLKPTQLAMYGLEERRPVGPCLGRACARAAGPTAVRRAAGARCRM